MKRLDLKSWQVNYATHDQGLEQPAHIARLEERQRPYFVKSYPRINDNCPHPDGRYRSQVGRKVSCVFVVNGIAYVDDVRMFDYDLSNLNAVEKVGSVDSILEFADLEFKLFGSRSERVQQLLRGLSLHRQTREHRLNFLRFKKRLNKRIAERKLNK